MKIHELHLATIKYFIDTVETGSFTQAAERNHVSRPAISQALLRLEDWAGIQLINHKKKGFQLTKDGEDFYRKAKKSYDNFNFQLTGDSIEDRGLKVGCSTSLADDFLLPTLKKLKNLSKVEIKVGTSSQLIQMLEDKVINIAIIIDDPVLPNFQTEVLAKGKFHFVSKNGKINNTIVVTEDRPEVIALKRWLFKKDIFPEIVRTESWNLGIKLADALDATFLVPDFIHGARFKKVSTPGYEHSYKVVLAHHKNEFLSETEAEFCKLVKKL